MSRQSLARSVEFEVLTRSRRRCALCFGLEFDATSKKGQIAHLDRNPANSAVDNLVFLCLDHHAEYDAVSPQTKRLRPDEVKKFRDDLYKHIERISDIAQVEELSSTGSGYVAIDEPGLDRSVASCLGRLGITLYGVDGYLEICRAPGWRGWADKFVEMEELGDYDPPPEIERIIRRYPVSGGVKPRYGLRGIRVAPVLDDLSPLRISVLRGWYHLVYALTRESAESNAQGSAFRRWAEERWWPLETSRVWHNVNCQAIVVTSDRKILLFRRSDDVSIYPGRWSASLEEQMQRTHGSTSGDDSLFDCVHRGVREELGVDSIPESTRLLSIGIEWLNFSASFLFNVYTDSKSTEVAELWSSRAADPYEAMALDFIPAFSAELESAIGKTEWRPTKRIRSRCGRRRNLLGLWHPTARARLIACARHIGATK